MKISEILWRAANERLAADEWRVGLTEYSCWAVRNVIHASAGNQNATIDFLESLGVDSESASAFLEFETGEQRQGARYLWLMFAHEVAKSEGL